MTLNEIAKNNKEREAQWRHPVQISILHENTSTVLRQVNSSLFKTQAPE